MEELPDAVPVMDPFHLIRSARYALGRCRQRVQQAMVGHLGRSSDQFYTARRTRHAGADVLADKQYARLEEVFAADGHVEVEATWGVYQPVVASYRARGTGTMLALITSIGSGVLRTLNELTPLGHTMNPRAADVLAYFDRPGASPRPTEAINGRLKHLCGSALGLRNPINYITRRLLETGGYTLDCDEPFRC